MPPDGRETHVAGGAAADGKVKTENAEISKKKAWTIILISLLDDIVILILLGLAVWHFNITMSWWLWVIIGLGLAGFIFVRTWAVVPALRRKKISGAEGMIGEPGRVVQPLTPEGTVRVGIEYWHAVSLEGDIEAGEQVEIVRLDRLKLEVKRRES
jgi:membrane protein implicated in regulation of membrane protease activity